MWQVLEPEMNRSGSTCGLCPCRWTLRHLCPCLWLRLNTANSRASTRRVLCALTSSCLDLWWRYNHTHAHEPFNKHCDDAEQSHDPHPPSSWQVNNTEAEFAKKALFSRHPEMIDWPSDHNWFFAKFNITQVPALKMLIMLIMLQVELKLFSVPVTALTVSLHV